MERQFRSRRAEVASFRAEILAKGATLRHVAVAIRSRFNVNSRVAYRYAHGLTQQQVANRWNELWPATSGNAPITHKNISYWEAWPMPTGRQPALEDLNRLARIYRCAAAELLDGEDHTGTSSAPVTSQYSRVDSADSDQPRAEPSDVVARVDSLIAASGGSLLTREANFQDLVQGLIEWAYRMKRRDILQWLSWAAASAAASPMLVGLNGDERERTMNALLGSSRADESVIKHIDGVLWSCMRQDDLLGPQAALDTVLAQRRLVHTLISSSAGPLGRRLLSLYANLSRFAGWLSFDLNNNKAAADYYETARAAAHEAQDTELGAFVLCNMSHLASWQGHPRIGIDHALAAIGWASRTDDPQLIAYAHDVAARAYAMDRQQTAALDAIESARKALSHPPDGTITHAYFYGVGQLASTESICHLHLGQPERGAEVGEVALKQIDGSFVRNLALTSLRIGICHLRTEEPDAPRGARAIADAARLSVHNRSARLNQRLTRAWNDLAPWDGVAEVKAIRDEMTGYGIG